MLNETRNLRPFGLFIVTYRQYLLCVCVCVCRFLPIRMFIHKSLMEERKQLHSYYRCVNSLMNCLHVGMSENHSVLCPCAGIAKLIEDDNNNQAKLENFQNRLTACQVFSFKFLHSNGNIFWYLLTVVSLISSLTNHFKRTSLLFFLLQ